VAASIRGSAPSPGRSGCLRSAVASDSPGMPGGAGVHWSRDRAWP
jgi:hypothetical protein